jgi:hypothetical protein
MLVVCIALSGAAVGINILNYVLHQQVATKPVETPQLVQISAEDTSSTVSVSHGTQDQKITINGIDYTGKSGCFKDANGGNVAINVSGSNTVVSCINKRSTK